MDTRRRHKLYDAWAPTYDRRLETGSAPLSFDGYEQVLHAAFQHAKASAGMRVLDLGTGTGNLAAYFVRAGCNVWGLDFSGRMLVRAKRKLAHLRIVRASLLAPSWPILPCFDRVVSSYALHDFDLGGKAMLLRRLVQRHLAHDGRIVIADIAYPNRAALKQAQSQWGRLWNEHEHYWAADETIATCWAMGLHCAYTQISHCAGVFAITRRKPPFLLALGLIPPYKQHAGSYSLQGDSDMSERELERLLSFFKALANESRLKILGILANRECSVSDLADLLDLREPTVSHHLAKLKELDLVRMEAEGNTHIYSLNEAALAQMSKDVFTAQHVAALVEDVDELSWEEKVLNTFVIDDRLTQIPVKHKKRRVILQWLAGKFKPGVRYAESEVNEIIKRYHPDTAALRRYLVDEWLMQRDHGIYWRVGLNKKSWKDKVLETFIVDGRLTHIPAKQKKRMVILEWLAEQFEPERQYSEPELNEVIKRYHEDTASLRRDLVGWRFMQREQGLYWRVPQKEQQAFLAGYPGRGDVVSQ
jgi:ubiquinone/menaquinone biosynthesis C-methylase UbiE/predicted transcriptional regulator